MVEITVFIICIVQQCGQSTVRSVIQANIAVGVNTHSRQGAKHLSRAFRRINATPLNTKGILPDIIIAKILLDDFKSLIQLSLNTCTIGRIIVIGSHGLHHHGNHVQTKSVRQISMIEKRFQQHRSRPLRVGRHSVVAHIQCNQRKGGAVDRITAAIVVENLHKVIHFVAVLVRVRFAVVVLSQIGTINTICSQCHDFTVNVCHRHVGIDFKLGNSFCNRCRTHVVQRLCVETQIHVFPVIRRRASIPCNDLIDQRPHIIHVGVFHGFSRHCDRHGVTVGCAVLCSDCVGHGAAKVLRIAGSR